MCMLNQNGLFKSKDSLVASIGHKLEVLLFIRLNRSWNWSRSSQQFRVLCTRVRTWMYSCFSGEIVLFDHTFTFQHSVPLMVYIFTTYIKVKQKKWGVHYLLISCNVQNETRHTDPWPKQCKVSSWRCISCLLLLKCYYLVHIWH